MHPAQEDVAGGLHQPLPHDDALALVLVDALARVRFEHRRHASLNCRKRGWPSAEKKRPDQAARADAADADDLHREVFQAVAIEQHAALVGQAITAIVFAAPRGTVFSTPSSATWKSTGGWSTRRCRPSTCGRRSWGTGTRRCAARASSTSCFADLFASRHPGAFSIRDCMSRRSYQTSSGLMLRAFAHVLRGRRARTRRPRPGPAHRSSGCRGPATAKLAARRLTSHSHGAGSVSSKSLMSKTRLRSGVAKMPKFSRWQSPHACTCRPVLGERGQVVGHQARRAAQEGERAAQHAPITDGHQFRHAIPIRFFQDVDRVASLGRRLPGGVALARQLLAQRLARRHALVSREKSGARRLGRVVLGRPLRMLSAFRHATNLRIAASRSGQLVQKVRRVGSRQHAAGEVPGLEPVLQQDARRVVGALRRSGR